MMDRALEAARQRFPVGTRVRVRARSAYGLTSVEAVTTGTVQGWARRATGSWHAHYPGGRVQLCRLQLRKDDGEESWLVVDAATQLESLGE